MSDRLGRLHKIIITQHWSELPHWHFHTTSDPCSNLWGHDQGQGSARAPVIRNLTGPSRLFLLHLAVFFSFFFLTFFSLALSLSPFCLTIAHILLLWPGPIETSHLLRVHEGKQEKKINSKDEWRPGGPIRKRRFLCERCESKENRVLARSKWDWKMYQTRQKDGLGT